MTQGDVFCPVCEVRLEPTEGSVSESNAANRSRRMRREGEPESDDIRGLFVTLTSAVSVLWAVRKPDWKFS